MNAYFFLSRTDDETDAALKDLTRFSVRTTGCFGGYAAITVESVEELREVGERIAGLARGGVRVALAAETTYAMSATSGGVPPTCYDPNTGQIDWNCLGQPRPSLGPKAAYFAVVDLRVEYGESEAVHEQLTVTGGVTGMVRLIDPNRLLLEVGASDPDLLMKALDGIASVRGIARMRSGIAVSPLEVKRAESA